MTKDQLIVKQQLKIQEQKKLLKVIAKNLKAINGMFVNIGAPLNDNILQFNKEQLKWGLEVNDRVENYKIEY